MIRKTVYRNFGTTIIVLGINDILDRQVALAEYETRITRNDVAAQASMANVDNNKSNFSKIVANVESKKENCWKCPNCNFINNSSSITCKDCGTYK